VSEVVSTAYVAWQLVRVTFATTAGSTLWNWSAVIVTTACAGEIAHRPSVIVDAPVAEPVVVVDGPCRSCATPWAITGASVDIPLSIE
jgi:hypothetical protein